MYLGIEGTAHTLEFSFFDPKKEGLKEGDLIKSFRNFYFPEGEGMSPKEVLHNHKNYYWANKKKIFEFISKKGLKEIFYASKIGFRGNLEFIKRIAKEISKKFNVPSTPVGHLEGHFSIVEALSNERVPTMCLFISGGNTQILLNQGNKLRLLVDSLDIGMGNLFDKIGRFFGKGYSGPFLERLAIKGEKFIPLPIPFHGPNFEFSGIYSKTLSILEEKKETFEDIIFSLLETSFSTILLALEKQLFLFDVKRIIGFGGVFSNGILKEKILNFCRYKKIPFISEIPRKFLIDNGFMIGVGGLVNKNFFDYLN